MKAVIISPWSKNPQCEAPSPKNYPFWPEVTSALKHIGGFKTTQIGLIGEDMIGADEIMYDLPLKEVEGLLLRSNTFVSVDNFLPHLAHNIGRHGVVIWGQSDPRIFGYDENDNLLKSGTYLRQNQFGLWSECEYVKAAFVSPTIVVDSIRRICATNIS